MQTACMWMDYIDFRDDISEVTMYRNNQLIQCKRAEYIENTDTNCSITFTKNEICKIIEPVVAYIRKNPIYSKMNDLSLDEIDMNLNNILFYVKLLSHLQNLVDGKSDPFWNNRIIKSRKITRPYT